jgi:hypothetical protein
VNALIGALGQLHSKRGSSSSGSIDDAASLTSAFRGAAIRHMQRPMNIGPLIQDVYDIEERGLDRHAIRPHRFG